MNEDLIRTLTAITPAKTGEALARHTTFGIGGPADVFVTVRSADELAKVVAVSNEAGASIFVLGAGSNILVGDRGVRGVVIDNQAKAKNVTPLTIGADSAVTLPAGLEGVPAGDLFVVRAESGVSFAALARNLARDGYAGVEWACGIPGTIGGAAVYNAGAYDGCFADALFALTICDRRGNVTAMPREELGYAYRTSVLQHEEFAGDVVLSAELAVQRGEPAALLAQISRYDEQRLNAQPRGRNSGSTFKNPPGDQAWELIDRVGLRGYRIGDAQFSQKHCNFIENIAGAKAADVYALIREAQRRVRDQYGIELQNEVELVGEGFE